MNSWIPVCGVKIIVWHAWAVTNYDQLRKVDAGEDSSSSGSSGAGGGGNVVADKTPSKKVGSVDDSAFFPSNFSRTIIHQVAQLPHHESHLQVFFERKVQLETAITCVTPRVRKRYSQGLPWRPIATTTPLPTVKARHL